MQHMATTKRIKRTKYEHEEFWPTTTLQHPQTLAASGASFYLAGSLPGYFAPSTFGPSLGTEAALLLPDWHP